MIPLFMMLVFGYTSGDIKHIKVKIVDLDEGIAVSPWKNISISNMIISNLSKETLDIVSICNEQAGTSDAIKSVKNGEIWAAIIFPKDFSFKLNQSGACIDLYLDGSNPQIIATIIKTINEAVTKTLATATNFSLPVIISLHYIYGSEDTRFIDYFAPGIMGLAILLVTVILTIVSFVRERGTGTLDRLLVSPIKETEIVVGYSIAFGIIGFIQSIVALASAILIFRIVIEGSVILALGIVTLFAIGNQGLGILLSSAAKNELQAVQFIPAILFPSILLSGVFWPIESIPSVLRPLSKILPLTYAGSALRSVMLRGWGLERILLPVFILVLYAILMLVLSVVMLRRRM